MFGIGTLFYAILFFINGIAVLSEDRFLNRIGWSTKPQQQQQQSAYIGFNGGMETSGDSIKTRLINLIGATRTLLRIPLIVVNILVILYELVLG